VGDSDGGEDGAERSPGGEDFRFRVPDGAGLDHGGREAVESEGEETSGISAEAAATYHSDAPRRVRKPEKEGAEASASRGRVGVEQALAPGKQRAAVRRESNGEC